jgi:hypothetical protein
MCTTRKPFAQLSGAPSGRILHVAQIRYKSLAGWNLTRRSMYVFQCTPKPNLKFVPVTSTSGYSQVVGFLDQTKIGLQPADYGGEGESREA